MNSMLGVHINAHRDQAPWLRRAQPRAGVILLDGLDPAWMRSAKAASPHTFWVGRLVDYRSPAQLLERAEPFRGLIGALVGENEVAVHTSSEMAAYAERERERTEILHSAGWLSVVGNFSTGAPELELWPAFYRALENAFALGLHEYSPTLPRFAPDDLWHQLRHRQVYHRLPLHLWRPLIITECGVDDGKGGGWKKHGSVEQYLDYLAWWDSELAESARLGVPIGGAAAFCMGRVDADPWGSFDISGGMADVLAAHLVANPPTPWQPKPIKEEPTVTTYRIGPIFERWGGYPVTGGFGVKTPPYPATGHLGVDYGCPVGTPVLAAFDGVVDLCDAHASKGDRINIVNPPQLLEAVYYHLREVPPFRPGDTVKAGQVIGYTGNTGQSTGPHLHFGLLVVRNDPPAWSALTWIDPLGAGVEMATGPDNGEQGSRAEISALRERLARIKVIAEEA